MLNCIKWTPAYSEHKSWFWQVLLYIYVCCFTVLNFKNSLFFSDSDSQENEESEEESTEEQEEEEVEESEEEPVQYTQDIRRTVRKGNYLKWNEN